MITFWAARVTLVALLLSLLAGCSREQQDWRSAEAADTIEAYGHFIQRHPESELATQARTRSRSWSSEYGAASAGRNARRCRTPRSSKSSRATTPAPPEPTCRWDAAQ